MDNEKKVLVIDDDKSHLDSVADVLLHEGYTVFPAINGTEGLAFYHDQLPDIVLTDLRMREMSGMDVLQTLKNEGSDCPIIVMTAFTTLETAIEAMKNGAYDYISKPFKLDQLRLVVNRAFEQSKLQKENKRLKKIVKEQQNEQTAVVGRSPEMVEIYKLIAKVAPLKTTVLIQGESGTGKEVVARLLHENSGCTGPYMAINCGALAEGVLESELFGHVKGSFTGAHVNKVGLFEAAENGTCFLDEISNTSLALQSKLLRVIEESEIMRVGSSQRIKINCRIIAATNQVLSEMVDEKLFRKDLYYRINVITITLPPLRNRLSDIPLLLDYFVDKYASQQGKEMSIHESVQYYLKQYHWPGNIRELAHAIERAIALNATGILTSEDFKETLSLGKPLSHDDLNGLNRLQNPDRIKTLAEMELEYIKWVINKLDNNMTKSATALGIDRRTLYRMLEREKNRP